MEPFDFFESVRNGLEYIDLQDTLNIIRRAIKNHQNIFIIGNGGSAAIASHFATDFRHSLDYRVKAISLTDNTSHITAIANDNGVGNIFVHQLYDLAEKGDLLIAFSCSGESSNIVHALLYANSADTGMETILFSGLGGYFIPVKERVTVMSTDFFVIESVFSAICHAIISAISGDYDA